MWMNEYEVQEAEGLYRDHPVLGPAVRTLRNLVNWTNRNSDGWPYWQKPARAAAKLMELIQAERIAQIRREHGTEPTVEKLQAALRPIKAFRTRQNADFEIVESLDAVEVVRTYRFVYEIEADTAQEAIDRLEELIATEGLGATPELIVTERVRT